MRQIESMNEPGGLMPVAVTLAGFAADDRSRLNTRIPIFTLIFARGGLYVGARGATGNEAVDVALAAILSIEDRKSVVEGKSWSVRVDIGGRSILKKKRN